MDTPETRRLQRDELLRQAARSHDFGERTRLINAAVRRQRASDLLAGRPTSFEAPLVLDGCDD